MEEMCSYVNRYGYLGKPQVLPPHSTPLLDYHIMIQLHLRCYISAGPNVNKMGIPRLNSYVKCTVPLHHMNLRDFRTIVIDGNNIYSKLYRNNNIRWKYGGEYAQFYRTIVKFLEEFVLAGVEVIVVLDGLMEPEKLCASKDSKLWSIKQLAQDNGVDAPLLRCQTFIDVLQMMEEEGKVELFVSEGDGDKDAAAIANQCSCPVLSDDSDFYMYELHHGMIPFRTLDLQTGRCSLYTTDLFQQKFGILDQNKWLRFLIPAMYGNDYLEPVEDPPGIGNLLRHINTRYLSSRSWPSKVQENFEAARQQYSNPTLLTHDDFRKKISRCYLPQWVIHAYGRGCFHPFLLNAKRDGVYLLPVVVEDVRQDSAWNCCRFIRRRMYAVMEVPPTSHVTEVVRESSSVALIKEKISPSYLRDRITNIQSISKMSAEEREWLILDILTNYRFLPDRLKKVFRKLDTKWKLPIAATNYWYRMAGGKDMEHLTKSLLLCFLHWFSKMESCFSKKGHFLVEYRSLPKPLEDLEIIHSFAQWQCVYHDAMALNCLAKECFHTTSSAWLFTGSTVMSFVACDTTTLQQGSIHVSAIFYQLLELVTFKIKSRTCRPRPRTRVVKGPHE